MPARSVFVGPSRASYHYFLCNVASIVLRAHNVPIGARIGDQDNRLFFEALLAEEQAHAVTLKDWLQQLQ